MHDDPPSTLETPTDKFKLPKRCPHCGQKFETRGGYARIRTAMRGFWPDTRRPIGIYGREDLDAIMCLTCYAPYQRVLDAMNDMSFNSYSAGRESGINHAK